MICSTLSTIKLPSSFWLPAPAVGLLLEVRLLLDVGDGERPNRRNGGKLQKIIDLLKMEEEEKTVIFCLTQPELFGSLAATGYNAAALVGDQEIDADIIR